MTKKDYELIANQIDMELHYLRNNFDTGEVEAVERLAKRLASRFQIDNPKFNTVKFLEACGVSSETLVVDTTNKTMHYED